MRQACSDCGRPILAWTKYRRSVTRPKADHDLCQKCWKAERDRNRVAVIPLVTKQEGGAHGA